MRQLIEVGIAVIVIIVVIIGAIKFYKSIPVITCTECDADYCGGCKAGKKVEK
jgi:hypothetical protein